MNSIQKIAQSAHLKYLRWMARSETSHVPVYVCEEMRKITRLLICMPEDQKNAATALNVFMYNREYFEDIQVTFVLNSMIHLPRALSNDYSVLVYSENDFNKLHLPSQNLKNHIAELGNNMAVDLSLNFSYLNAALTWYSRAKLRVGFHDENREEMYNFMLKRNQKESEEHAFQMLFNYLFFQNS